MLYESQEQTNPYNSIYPSCVFSLITVFRLFMHSCNFVLFLLLHERGFVFGQVLAKISSLDESKILKFFDLQLALNSDFDEMLQLVEKKLHKDPYSRDEVCRILEISEQELSENLLSENTRNGKIILIF